MFGVLADPSRGGCSGRLVAKHWPRRNQVVLAWIGKGSPFKASLSPRFAFERWQGPSCGLRNSASADSLPYFPQVLSGESNCSWVGGGCRPSCRRRILQSKAQKDVYSPTPSGKGSGEDPAVATLPFATDSQVYRRFYDTQKGDIFNKEDWDYHRSPFRYFRHVVTTVWSRALARTLIPCLAITFVAIFITLWNAVNPDYSVPLYSAGALNAISPVLGLLLVFRTNSAYGRFISAMQAWTDVIAFSRNFVRQGLTWFGSEETRLRSQLIAYTIAWCESLKCHLKWGKTDDLRGSLDGILPPDEIDKLLTSSHRPHYALQRLGVIIDNSSCSERKKLSLDNNIARMLTAFAQCERIVENPIPLSYTRHTSRIVFIWCLLLPFSLWESLGWGLVPGMFLVSYTLLGLEDVGVQIEEPFQYMPIEHMCDMLKRNIMEMEWHSLEAIQGQTSWRSDVARELLKRQTSSSESANLSSLHESQGILPSDGVMGDLPD